MAFVVEKTEKELSEEDIIDFSRSRMTKFKAPSRVKFMDAFPKSLTGKVEKKELRNLINNT